MDALARRAVVVALGCWLAPSLAAGVAMAAVPDGSGPGIAAARVASAPDTRGGRLAPAEQRHGDAIEWRAGLRLPALLLALLAGAAAMQLLPGQTTAAPMAPAGSPGRRLDGIARGMRGWLLAAIAVLALTGLNSMHVAPHLARQPHLDTLVMLSMAGQALHALAGVGAVLLMCGLGVVALGRRLLRGGAMPAAAGRGWPALLWLVAGGAAASGMALLGPTALLPGPPLPALEAMAAGHGLLAHALLGAGIGLLLRRGWPAAASASPGYAAGPIRPAQAKRSTR